jgi:UDP-glucuronate decarboxylase
MLISVMETPIFEKKNVLVTGGAGFIGSHLCEKLLREAKVICVDDFSNSHPQNINHLLQYPDFEFVNYDINKPIDLEQFPELDKFKIKFQGIQEIYHLACPTSPKDFEHLKMKSLLANSSAMINTLDVAVKYRAKYLFTSSSVVYGPATAKRPVFKETDQGVVDHLSPRACYDEGKRFAETCVETYRQVHGLEVKTARIFTTYGPRMKLFEGNPIIDWIIAALDQREIVLYGGENLSTSLCYVSDMVDGLVRLMASTPDVKIANLGGDEILTMNDVASMIIEMTQSQSKVKVEDELLFLTKKGAPDLHYVKDVLGWFPLVRLEDGLRKTVDYVTANKEALLFSYEGK